MVLWQSTTCWCYCRLLGNRSSVIQLFFGIFRSFSRENVRKASLFLEKQCFFKEPPKTESPACAGLFVRQNPEGKVNTISCP